MQAALALLLLLSAHNRSEGRSTFALDESGRVTIEITLGDVDMPELCNVDLAVRDPGLRDERERLLSACLERDLATLLRVRSRGGDAGDAPCPVIFQRATAPQGRGIVVIDAHATCPTLPRTLIVDWGLFASTPLDHVNIAKLEQPHADPKLVMLSKRSPKIVLDVASPLLPRLLLGIAVGVVVAGGAVAFALVRRRTNSRVGRASGASR